MVAATNTNLQTSAWGGRQVSWALTSPLGRSDACQGPASYWVTYTSRQALILLCTSAASSYRCLVMLQVAG